MANNVQLLADDPYGKGWLIKVRVDDPSAIVATAGSRRLREAGGRRRPLNGGSGRSPRVGQASQPSTSGPVSAATPDHHLEPEPTPHGVYREHARRHPRDVRRDRARLARAALRADPRGVPTESAAPGSPGLDRAGADQPASRPHWPGTRGPTSGSASSAAGATTTSSRRSSTTWPPGASSTRPTRPTSPRPARGRSRRRSNTRR